VLLAHPGTVAGMNIHGVCFHIVWFSVPWNLEHYIQSNWRLYRQGQTSKMVLCYHLTARGTLDEKVARVLSAKKATQGALEEALSGDPDA
jgi:SNF2 family DNA or RNA helicase